MNKTNFGLIEAASFSPTSVIFSNSWAGYLPFASWLIKQIEPTIFVELGTYYGNSYFGFCQAIYESGLQTKCYAVDTWKGEEHTGFSSEDIFQKVNTHNNEKYKFFSRLLRMNFDEALECFTDGSIGLLHIDGLHTYEAISHNFKAWLPKLTPGAIILLHNINNRGHGFDIWKFWEELKSIYPHNLEFMHSDGLGILQLDNISDDKKLIWLEPGFDKKNILRNYFGALGTYQLERFRLNEINNQKTDLTEQAINLGQAISERDMAVDLLTKMRASISWKLTAPVRFAGHLLKGNFNLVAQLTSHALNHIARRFLPAPNTNSLAITTLVNERCERTRIPITSDPMLPPVPAEWPMIDISIVTHNSERWIAAFVNSLISLDYPADQVSICFVDNSSSDGTEAALHAAIPQLQKAGYTVKVLRQANRGFGAGHNFSIRDGCAPFCLVTNIDLTFEPDSLRQVVAMATADVPQVAAWELRQKPYEHPKYYDPVTGTTNWNAHACVLLRRSALEDISGYDETLFMYGEDVELSYRLRRSGYFLRYCPSAVVWHYSYESANQIKPIQYTGSSFANLYLRLKYGQPANIIVIPILMLRLLLAPELFPGSRRQIIRTLLRLIAVAPKAFLSREPSQAHFPFYTWDYEMVRAGAFIEQYPVPTEQPLVSIITRTYCGRDLYLRQALLSSAHQTWKNLEHIVVEDGGNTMQGLCEEVALATNRTIRFIAGGNHGRSKTGNTGLAAAQGRWCVFLDDDDLLFADHVEILVNALLADPDAVASYSLAWEVGTDTSALAEGRYVEVSHNLPAVLQQPFDFDVLRHHNYFPIQSVLFERKLYEQRGGFFEDMEILEDWILWIRWAWNHRFVYVPKVTSMFRIPTEPAKVKKRAAAFENAYSLALVRANTCIMEYERLGASRLRDTGL